MKRVFLVLSFVAILALSACNIDTLSKIDARTEDISIAYPDADALTLELVISASGDVNVNGGGDMFVAGTVKYNVREWEPIIAREGDTVRIAQGEGAHGIPPRDAQNVWDLRLGDTVPFALDVRYGVGDGDWELGALPITDLNFEMGAGDNELAFGAPNPATMATLRIDGGVGDLRVRDLLNANAQYVDVAAGVGDIVLEFDGEALGQSIEVSIEGGVGNITIKVDRDVPARVVMSEEGVGSVNLRGAFARRSGGYETPAYAEAGDAAKIEIEMSLGVGSITLNTR